MFEHRVDPARPDEERVGEAVHVAHHFVGDGFVVAERHEEPFDATRDGARLVEERARVGTAGEDEVRERLEVALARIDRPLERFGVGGPDQRHAVPAIRGERREIAAEVEERILRPR